MNGLRPPRGGVRRELSSHSGYRRLVPAPPGSVLSSGGSLVRTGWLRRHLPPDVGLRPVRTQEKAAGLSSDWWKAHLQAPAKSSSYKTVVVFNYCVDTVNDFVKIWLDVCLSKIWIFWLRVLIDICSLLHAMVALLQQGCLAKRCKYGRIFCMDTHPADPRRANILPCPPIQKGGEWS